MCGSVVKRSLFIRMVEFMLHYTAAHRWRSSPLSVLDFLYYWSIQHLLRGALSIYIYNWINGTDGWASNLAGTKVARLYLSSPSQSFQHTVTITMLHRRGLLMCKLLDVAPRNLKIGFILSEPKMFAASH